MDGRSLGCNYEKHYGETLKIPVEIEPIDAVKLNIETMNEAMMNDNLIYADIAIIPSRWYEDSLECGVKLLSMVEMDKLGLRNWDLAVRHLIDIFEDEDSWPHKSDIIFQFGRLSDYDISFMQQAMPVNWGDIINYRPSFGL